MNKAESITIDLPSLDGLEEWERRKIMSVLQRDLDIQKQKDLHLRRLRMEIEKLSEPLEENISEKWCSRCRTQLGLLLNTGAPCPKCHVRVCVSCRIQTDKIRLGWMCILCDKTRQYAVLTGEWIHPQVDQLKRTRNLTKSNSTIALRIRNPNTENDYYPAAATSISTTTTTTEQSVSGILLRQLKQESMDSWKNVDTDGLPPLQNRSSFSKFADENHDFYDMDYRRPRSTSPQPAAWRHTVGVVGAVTAFKHAKGDAGQHISPAPARRHESLDSHNSALPILRVDHIEEHKDALSGSAESLRACSSDFSQLNAFHRVARCPSVPNQLDGSKSKHDNALTSLLSVHNVRVSIRSTSSDNVSNANHSRRDRNDSFTGSQRSRQHSDNDIQAAVAAYADRKRATLVGDKRPKENGNPDYMRPASQNSTSTTNDVSESWDENLSLSGESDFSFSSSITSSIMNKRSLKRTKDNPRGSMTSAYLSKITVQGEMLLSCNYNCVDASLEVNVIKCRNLYPMNMKKNYSNPYVKMYLLPDMSPLGKRKTRVKRRTVNPEYNEVLKFTGLTKSELEARTLLISVWHCDVLGRSHFMGEIRLSMSEYPWIPGETYWIPLAAFTPDDEPAKVISVPEMMVSLKFSCPGVGRKGETAGAVHCLVRCPQKLPNTRVASGTPIYIKCYLYPDYRKVTKQKSPIVKLGTDLSWHHNFVYDDLTPEELKERCLELTVWNHHRMGANEFLGGIRLNLGTGFSDGDKVDWMDSTDDESMMWKEFLAKSNTWIDATLPLRMDMESKL